MENNQLTHAGCIVFRPDDQKISYLIISSKNDKHWVLPKGHIKNKKKESAEEAALRELEEETGIVGEIVQPVTVQTYRKKDELVVIQYFIVRQIGRTQPEENRTLRWESEEKALDILSFEEAKLAFQQALEIIKRLP